MTQATTTLRQDLAAAIWAWAYPEPIDTDERTEEPIDVGPADDAEDPEWPHIYAAGMSGSLDPDDAFEALMEICDALHADGDHRQARYVSDCAAKVYDTKIQGGIDGAVAAASAHRHRERCRMIVRRDHRRAHGRSSRRRVGSRLAAKATSAGDPDPEPDSDRRRRACSSRGASW